MRLRGTVALGAVALLVAPSLRAQLLGGQFRVNPAATGYQHRPAAAVDGQGNAVVVWTEGPYGSPSYVAAQRFDDALTPIGGAFRVSTSPFLGVGDASVACAASGSFVVAWIAPDNDKDGVFAQRFDAA